MDFVKVSPDGTGFVLGDKPYVPFGANYFDPATGWAPKMWSQYDGQIVRRQLGQLAGAGYNTIRVFLAVKSLEEGDRVYSEEGFARVADLIAAAKESGIRIIFSGPNHWEGPVEHRHHDPYTNDEAMAQVCDLWREIIRHWGDEPTVMTWDLLNEPMVRWPSRKHFEEHPDRKEQYLQSPRWEMFKTRVRDRLGMDMTQEQIPYRKVDGQDPKIWAEHLRFCEDLAEHWTREQCDAIRNAGAKQMITIGYIQWTVPSVILGGGCYAGFAPEKTGKHLDYTSVHFYPMTRDNEIDLGSEEELQFQKLYLETVMRGARVAGKPMVMQEFGWHGGKQTPQISRAWPEEHQSKWGDALMEITERAGACGWLNWCYADAPEATDVSAASGLFTAEERIKHWGKRMAEHARRLAGGANGYQPPQALWKFDRAEWLMRHDGQPLQNDLAALLAENPDSADGVEIKFTTAD